MSEVNRTTDLTLFQFENADLRTKVDADGLLWLVATDVCRVLRIKNTAHALSRLDHDEKGIVLNYTPYGAQEILMVNEPGLYSLILGSRKKKLPEVQRFKRWVTHEVIPSIRRTGQYTMPDAPSVQPSNHLPPPPRYTMQERAHVSEHLLAVWTTLRQAEEPITNADIMAAAHLKDAVTRKWTRYLLHLGLLDMYETHPRHLFAIASQADKRHAGYYQRLERLAAIMEKRQQRLYR